MQTRIALIIAAALAITNAASAGAQTAPAPTETNFQVKSTGDLVRLCEAKPGDATGIAALHFCHGFAVGAYQYYQIVEAAEGKPPLFCPPNPTPSRNEIISDFVVWANQNRQQLNTPPVEGIFRYLAQRYPCRA